MKKEEEGGEGIERKKERTKRGKCPDWSVGSVDRVLCCAVLLVRVF